MIERGVFMFGEEDEGKTSFELFCLELVKNHVWGDRKMGSGVRKPAFGFLSQL